MKGICPTLLAAMGSRFERIPFFYDDFSVRLMTPRECARLQSFPDDYKFYGSDGMKRLEIGNAVPPLLSMAVAKEMILALE